MHRNLLLKHCAFVATASLALASATDAAKADDLPAYMQTIAGGIASSPAETATKDVLALNIGMFELYGDCRQNLPRQHPRPASCHPRLVLRSRRPVHPLSARPSRRSKRRRCRSFISC